MNRGKTQNSRQNQGSGKKTTDGKKLRLAKLRQSDKSVLNDILSQPVYTNQRKPIDNRPDGSVGFARQRNMAHIRTKHESHTTPLRKRIPLTTYHQLKPLHIDTATFKPSPMADVSSQKLVPLPHGELLSSAHESRRQIQLKYNRQFSHKYLPTRVSLMRELKQDRYERMRLPNQVFTLMASGVSLPKDVTVFKVPMTMSKPMIKNYLEEIYNVRVKKVNTAIMIGGKRVSKWGVYKKLPDYKKAYVRTSEPFFFPWPRPGTFPLTDKQKKRRKEQAEREAKESEEDGGKNAV